MASIGFKLTRVNIAASLFTLSLLAAPVHAAVIVKTIAFNASTNGPISSHIGSFTMQYDDVTNAAVLLDINYSIGSTIFNTANTGLIYAGNDVQLGRSYFIGGVQSSVQGVGSNTNDFRLHFSPYTLMATGFTYSSVGSNLLGGGNITLIPVTAVPEPTTWLMMLLGFFGIGTTIRVNKLNQKLAVKLRGQASLRLNCAERHDPDRAGV